MRCSWRQGCSNADVRTFWWWCGACGKRFGLRINRCDYHRPNETEQVCNCKAWWELVGLHDGPQLYDPFSATALSDWLDA